MPVPSSSNPFTLTYSEGAEGWPSFYTYFPEYIKGMNGYLYTFQNGNMYRHNTNSIRNNYYGVQGTSSVTSVFNPQPSVTIKLFKTLSFESNQSWNCTSLLTDLSQGNVPELNFEQKEGEWFAYIRHNTGVTNFSLRYSNGLGNIVSVTGIGCQSYLITNNTGSTGFYEVTDCDGNVLQGTLNSGTSTTFCSQVVPTVSSGLTISAGSTTCPTDTVLCTFNNNIGNIITNGATAYTLAPNSSPSLAGQVIEVVKSGDSGTVTLDTTIAGATAPVAGQFLLFVNNTIAESYGMRGYYMEFTLVNDDTTPVELFAVGSSVMKSFP